MMSEEFQVTRCPCCGSVFIKSLEDSGMWECQYHLCRAVFPLFSFAEPDQVPLVAEDDPLYPDYGRKNRSKTL